MNQAQAAQLARQEMAKNGLNDWDFKINGRLKNTLGRCNYTKRLIELSASFIENNGVEQVLDTILHEIAHALTPGDGHGEVWKAMCRKLGCRPEAYASTKNVSMKWKWQLAVKLPTGSVERLRHFAHRRTSMANRMVRNRPETKGRLVWVEADV